MTPEEAVIIAKIAATADGGCSTCTSRLFGDLQQAFPDHDWFELSVAAGCSFPRDDMEPEDGPEESG